ncbi:type 11 methyltransferase [Candidatus Magnetobacterium bavaricum]|uniref:Type 11 methyltransferase n=1 Tax=Candidatus Magnetobacterium bavaricum TaxID=29290 RepID=A0A0F3GRB8_9BACT|nr:type 11 methyltransferase [Candidatus Magnetobacterium bavaricum]
MTKPDTTDASFYDMAWDKWNDMIYYSPAPRIRRSKIVSMLKETSFTSLLDVGCGNGEFLKDVKNSIGNVNLAGADISCTVIKSNRTKLSDMEFFVLDLDNETLCRKFDLVVCMEVVEHCRDYVDAIIRLAEMTDKMLIMTVPCGPLFDIDRRVGHNRHFSTEDIRTAIENAGLTVFRLYRWGFPFFNLYKHVINMSPDKMTDSFLSEKPYTWKQKVIAKTAYATFKLCLPLWGYQLFVQAVR